jgi:hypothetical protein
LATLDKNISNALLEYSFSVVDQSQYNQQTAAFVNTVKDIFINENSWQQLQNNDTREKIANFLKQYYDSGIIDSNIRFLETITSKQEALGALSSLLTTLVRNRRIYNDVNLQRVQSLIANYGKYALSVLDYPIIMDLLLLKMSQILDVCVLLYLTL